MLILEILPNPNCEAVEMRIFHDLEPPRPVSRVRIDRAQDGRGVQWCAITGWLADGTPCPALARKVDDSGEGVVILVSGGDAGLRLQPADRQAPWRLDNPSQWGGSFLLIPDSQDLQ